MWEKLDVCGECAGVLSDPVRVRGSFPFSDVHLMDGEYGLGAYPCGCCGSTLAGERTVAWVLSDSESVTGA